MTSNNFGDYSRNERLKAKGNNVVVSRETDFNDAPPTEDISGYTDLSSQAQ